MADTLKPIFTIDASQILSKLHLAGKVAVNAAGNKVWLVYNTGVTKEKSSDTPQAPSGTIFDLKNDSGLYELGIFKPYEFKAPEITEDIDTNIIKLKEKLAKLTDKNEKSNISDGDEKSSDEIEKINEEIEKAKLKLVEDNKKRLAEYNKSREEFQKKAFDLIKIYFKSFVGQKNSSKINENSIVEFRLPLDTSIEDKTNIKNFKIIPINPQEMKKEDEENKKLIIKNNDGLMTTCSGFKVGYTIQNKEL